MSFVHLGTYWNNHHVSLLIYAVAIAVASFSPALSGGLYSSVALMWLIPDRRMEKALAE